MLRLLASGLAALLLSACAYGSAVDMAPMNARVSKPVIPPGAYCEAQQAGGAWRIVSSNDCIPVTWDAKTRTYAMEDDTAPDDVQESAIVSLGGGLYLAQITEADDGPFDHHIHLLLAKGGAFAILPVLDDDGVKALAARHAKVIFRTHGNRPYIAAGKVSDIKAFLKDAAQASLLKMREEGEPLSLGVRDAMGAPDHPATRAQVKDIEAVMKAARKLAPQ